MDKMINQPEAVKEGLSIIDILHILKRYIVLLIAVIIAFTAVGVAYSFVQKPEYTVTQKLSYKCKNLPYVNSKGETVNADTTTSNINTMMAYGDTIMDLFDEGVVLDRANYYYKEYLNANFSSKISVDEFLATLAEKDNYIGSEEQLNLNKNIVDTQIGTYDLTEEQESKFAFTVSYTEDERQVAIDKLSILVYAFEKECFSKTDAGNVKYFGEFEVIVSNLGQEKVENNVSKLKTIILFFAVGIVASLVVVLIVNMLDNTVKEKEELERLTGATTLSAIEKTEE